MKIGIVFDCQHEGLARSLRFLRPSDEVANYELAVINRSPQAHAAAVADAANWDAVIASPGAAKRLEAEFENLRQRGSDLLVLPPIVFAGYHPDVIRLDHAGERLAGPTNALHSRIAIVGFLGGLTVPQTAALFNRLVFSRLGYFHAFEVQRKLMILHYEKFGVDMQPWFASWQAQGCFMHSSNHPKAAPMLDLARIACRLLQLEESADFGSPNPEDALAHMPCHPVHADIAARLGIQPEAGFRTMGTRKIPSGEWLSLDEFLRRSFEVYERVPRAILSSADKVVTALEALELTDSALALK